MEFSANKIEVSGKFLKIATIIGIILAIVFLIMCFYMIKTSYADDHTCQTQLWARYVGYFLLVLALFLICKNGYILYMVSK